jgi:aquaporin Z
MADTLSRHWPEYLCEAAGLGLFMVSATAFASVLFHPGSVLGPGQPPIRRALMGLAMGATAAAIVYSPLGRRSGAHLNPAVTLAFFRLGKIAGGDAAFYIASQLAGGLAGMLGAATVFRRSVAHASVNYVVTVPGPAGAGPAFAAEVVIAGGLMAVVLAISNTRRLAPFTGVFAGALVATYIAIEAPISGMSMNPARTIASAVPAGVWTAFWVYMTAPLVGMMGTAELYRALRLPVICAKLHHVGTVRCIFRCGYASRAAATAPMGGAPARALETLPENGSARAEPALDHRASS